MHKQDEIEEMVEALPDGYHNCTCRDCFEISIGQTEEGLCSLCVDAGCEAFQETECCVLPDDEGGA